MFNPVLMRNYPKTKRDSIIRERVKVSEEQREIARPTENMVMAATTMTQDSSPKLCVTSSISMT
jgi:hypothetical protein